MEKIIKNILILGLWYLIFCFVTEELNPMEWSTTAKVLAIIIGLVVVGIDD
jgi:hypothetical protein